MEGILIPVIIFSSLLLFLKMMLDYGRFKHEHKAGTRSNQGTTANSLRVSELEMVVRDAVDDAVRPLERRIRRLERATRRDGDASIDYDGEATALDIDEDLLTRRGLPAAGSGTGVLDADLLDEYEDDERRVRRPRVRRS